MPKSGEEPSTNCDRVAVKGGEDSASVLRIVIADGVSQSYDPASWAEALVRELRIDALDDDPVTTVAAVAAATPLPEAEDLAWNMAVLRERGAQSTVLLIEGRLAEAGWRFDCRSIGDCLVVLEDSRAGEPSATITWPAATPADFDVVPDRLCTEPPYVIGEIRRHSVLACAPTRMLVMTDAVARYVIAGASSPEEIWGLIPLTRETTDAEFAEWVERLRAAEVIEDDDSTVGFVQWL